MKRFVDVLVSAIGLAVLSPLLLLVAVAVRLGNGKPVFYRQKRVGREFEPFWLYKFRTMQLNAETSGPGVTVSNDPRVTRLGRFLRYTKLDELPQLYNVLKGDMSLVGPRPELGRYVRLFRDAYRDILQVRPGVTDLASIAYRHESTLLTGDDDPEATYVRSILPDKIRLAKMSIKHGSVWHDLGVVLETLIVLLYPAQLVERIFQRASRNRAIVAMFIQVGIAAAAVFAALEIRFDFAPPAAEARLVLGALPLLLILRAAWFLAFRLHRDIWQYVGLPDLRRLVISVMFGTVTFGLLLYWPLGLGSFPRSILLLDALLCVVGLTGIRIMRRSHHELRSRTAQALRVLIVGVDDSTDRVVRGLASLGRRVVGIVGTVPGTTGLRINDVPIIGSLDQLAELLRAHSPDEILVVGSALPQDQRKEVIHRCRVSGKPVKVISDLGHLIDGNGHTPQADLPDADDLLFRDPVQIDLAAVTDRFRGRRVLVTGAGGSIGSEISMQIAACHPSRLVLLEKHEESLFHIERRLRRAYDSLAIEPMIADIRDAERVNEIFAATQPEIVFHAAAYKHVPMMERNPSEALKTNVAGTRIVAEAAGRHGVETFASISTDKAVEPLSVMGATKRLAELTIQEIAAESRTRFLIVRFGNVLDSSGSVIPTFRDQIERRAPITVTHPDITRWFMTVPEAVHLILESVTIGDGGEVFVLDMGKPVRILDLARSLIRQYGLEPERDIPIVYTGLRPGERLFEKLFNDHETVCKTAHPRILMAVERHELGNSNGIGRGTSEANGHANGNGNGNGNGAGNGRLRTHAHARRTEEKLRLLQMIKAVEQSLTPPKPDPVRPNLEEVAE
jgi:FlaA1/EpsC-like NDP-sugar epimerase/lipopolysaccharide/colanic/teichoic acid biosynthesis glycosyltransferase